MELIRHLDVVDVARITNSIKTRQEKFDEDFVMSVGVVLMNYGDQYVKVECVRGEWKGQKKDLEGGEGIPKCPNGHVLIETSRPPMLALIED